MPSSVSVGWARGCVAMPYVQNVRLGCMPCGPVVSNPGAGNCDVFRITRWVR